jgi:glycine/D-amino acid oxidase-like deaminating enzyme
MKRDVLVIGAGVLGLSSALHLKRRSPGKSVAVIDRLGGPGQGNTAKSAGIFLNLFTTEVNRLLGDSTIDWFFHLQNGLGYDLDLHQCGYLYLLDEDRYRKMRGPVEEMCGRGVEVETFNREELAGMIPDLVTELDDEAELMGLKPVDHGVLGMKCGSVNTDALARSLEAEFIKMGGAVSYNTEAERLIVEPERRLGVRGEPFVWQDIRVVGAETSRGRVEAETTVVAAGTWSERLLDPIGFDTLARPKSRSIFVFKDPRLGRLRCAVGFSGLDMLPFTQIAGISVYLKAEPTEGSVWLGCADDFGRRYGLEDDPRTESRLYSNNIYHALVKYLPCFKDVRPVNMWTGQRAVNSVDRTPVVAPAPGMIYVGSASGYGITKSDALGRTVAAVYSGDNEATLYGDRSLQVADLGVEARNVGHEMFKV